MISIKSKDEIAKLKKSAAILAEVKQELKTLVRPGATGLELDTYAEKRIRELGGTPSFKGYMGFQHTLCISLNEDLIHGIPNNIKFKDGDIVKIDMGAVYKGYHSDSAFTIGLGTISKQDKKVIDVAEQSFYKGIDAIKPGARIGDIGHAIGSFVDSKGLYVPDDFTGHGIGSSLHEEPYIPNYGNPGTGPLLRDGMVICIEPMIMQDTEEVVILEDGWTVRSISGKNTSHYEQTILIENGYPVILTEKED
ncbi:type I methionyl aminopeptidase [Mycoplasma todarodis]|uniref:Methionine aminopeptidase n=1 Tax=Mycoplasma todarodis TaxID=1937191 RepID=A0A4V2NHZ9_9MOLU|nr:type I methionyl aminopeptidase [Mycoplasma todarodis]TCG10858.1 type I methionyl aminopeptidase [Mycoplasma todarodis]